MQIRSGECSGRWAAMSGAERWGAKERWLGRGQCRDRGLGCRWAREREKGREGKQHRGCREREKERKKETRKEKTKRRIDWIDANERKEKAGRDKNYARRSTRKGGESVKKSLHRRRGYHLISDLRRWGRFKVFWIKIWV
jgi:hypothetical protein